MGKRAEQTPHQRRYTQVANERWIDVQHSMSLGNCKLKWETTACLLEWSKFKTLTQRMLVRVWSNIADGDVNGSDAGRQFGNFLQKLNMLLPYDPTIAHFGIYPM